MVAYTAKRRIGVLWWMPSMQVGKPGWRNWGNYPTRLRGRRWTTSCQTTGGTGGHEWESGTRLDNTICPISNLSNVRDPMGEFLTPRGKEIACLPQSILHTQGREITSHISQQHHKEMYTWKVCEELHQNPPYKGKSTFLDKRHQTTGAARPLLVANHSGGCFTTYHTMHWMQRTWRKVTNRGKFFTTSSWGRDNTLQKNLQWLENTLGWIHDTGKIQHGHGDSKKATITHTREWGFHSGERKTPKIIEERHGKNMHCGLPNKALYRKNACLSKSTPKWSIHLATIFIREPMVAHDGAKWYTILHWVWLSSLSGAIYRPVP